MVDGERWAAMQVVETLVVTLWSDGNVGDLTTFRVLGST